MCGIFGYVGYRDTAQTLVFNGLKTLEYRGYDSWGVGVIPLEIKKGIVVKKKAGKIGDANVKDLPKGQLAFGHTRWATHGGVTDINAHPHLDCRGNIAVIHNGIFENYQEIKQKLLSKGHKFISETDTETIPHLIEELSKKVPFVEAVRLAFNQMEGLNAIIVISAKENLLVAARNGSPLVIGFGKAENFLASDATALIPHTRDVCFLGDDEMAILAPKRVSVIEVKTGKKVSFKNKNLIGISFRGRKEDIHFLC